MRVQGPTLNRRGERKEVSERSVNGKGVKASSLLRQDGGGRFSAGEGQEDALADVFVGSDAAGVESGTLDGRCGENRAGEGGNSEEGGNGAHLERLIRREGRLVE